MAKTKRNKVNFATNKKVQAVVSHISLGEGRITRAEIMELANKDILYQLKNEGYIKETSKGIYTATRKLRTYVSKTDGFHFASSGSETHAKALRESLYLLPQSVIANKNYKTSTDVELSFKRNVCSKPIYQERLQHMISQKRDELSHIEEHYHKGNIAKDTVSHYTNRIDYMNNRDRTLSSLRLLESDKPYLVPDYQVTLNQEELSRYIDTLTEKRDSFSSASRNYEFYSQSVQTLSSLVGQGDVVIQVEVVTSHYGNREIELHRNFERLTDTPLIFVA